MAGLHLLLENEVEVAEDGGAVDVPVRALDGLGDELGRDGHSLVAGRVAEDVIDQGAEADGLLRMGRRRGHRRHGGAMMS